MTTQREQHNAVVAVASIAADLSSVMHIAWEVTLASKNAMVIAAQAGDKARGFQPITGLIDEIASATTDGVTQINHEALEVSRLAVEGIRAHDALRRFNDVARYAGKVSNITSLRPPIRTLEQRLVELTQAFRQHHRRLRELLDNLDEGMRAASAIASVCRIEASRAAEYRANLNVVAEDLDKAAIQIKEMIDISKKRLEGIDGSTLIQTQETQA